MKKRFLPLMLALALCLGLAVPAFADLTPTEELNPEKYLLENGVLIVSEGVDRIGDHAFERRSDIVRVELPSSVTHIGAYAFAGCSELASVTITGEGGLEVDNASFSGCSKMVLDLGNRYISKLSGDSFSNCKQLTSLDFSHLTWIPRGTFVGTGLASAVIPEGANMIGDEAFYNCKDLVIVSIPASVTYIGEKAFIIETEVPLEDGGRKTEWGSNPNLTIYGEAGSYAETYAQENGLKFVAGPAPAVPVQPTQPAQPETPAAQPATAAPTASTVTVNGTPTAFDAYNIGGANYFKLRDLAFVLNGTEKQFGVDWDAAANAISLTSGAPYAAVGGEMTPGTGAAQTPVPTSSKILLNGTEIALEAYNIGGNNYFKLRDIGSAFDFGVDWDAANNTVVIDTSKGYTPD